jgi:4-nitrophenyl phosphatase
MPGIEAALSAVARRIALGRPPRLVLPNPDLIYPAAHGFGFTSGAVALLLERGLERLGHPVRFEPLGKPEPLLFEEGARRAGSRRLLMVGDQLETDIAGARAAGLDAALLETGISRWRPDRAAIARPTYLVSSLAGA